MDLLSSWRAQLRFIAFGYAAVLLAAATLLYGRHLQELQYPIDAAGGMWAFGDALLYIFIACLFMIPTAFLVWSTAKFESFYERYSQFLLCFSLSAAACLAMLTLGEHHLTERITNICLYRLMWSPLILFGIGVSRLAARSNRAKRYSLWALLIEGLTLATAVAMLIHAWSGQARP